MKSIIFSNSGLRQLNAFTLSCVALGILLFSSYGFGSPEIGSEVERAIRMKRAGLSTSTILNLFDKEEIFVKFRDKKRELRSEDIEALKGAGFEDDFIEKWK